MAAETELGPDLKPAINYTEVTSDGAPITSQNINFEDEHCGINTISELKWEFRGLRPKA